MIRRHLVKTFALGLCMTALMVGGTNANTAYATSGGGTSGFTGTIGSEDSALFEKQKELDQYLFVDHAQDIEKLNFKIIYTGVADKYVEVGITPYSDENAKYIYNIFGDDLVKVVDTEQVMLYTAAGGGQDVATPIAPDNAASPIMDMGDTAVSDISAEEEARIKETQIREAEQVAEDEEFSIQIQSVEEGEATEDMDPELIWQTTVDEDLPSSDSAEEILEDGTDVKIVSAEDDMVKNTSVDIESEDKGLPTASVIAIVAGGAIIVGGLVAASSKKKTMKKDR